VKGSNFTATPVPATPAKTLRCVPRQPSAQEAFPDLSDVVEDTVVEGNKVAGRVTPPST
jgi:hypothetical protein